MRILRRTAPARIASPPPIRLRVPGSGIVVVDPPQLESMTLLSSVTAAVRARAAPQVMLAVVSRVMLVSARIVPANAVLVPRVAELPTCQNTFLSTRPLVKTTDELLPVVSE